MGYKEGEGEVRRKKYDGENCLGEGQKDREEREGDEKRKGKCITEEWKAGRRGWGEEKGKRRSEVKG